MRIALIVRVLMGLVFLFTTHPSQAIYSRRSAKRYAHIPEARANKKKVLSETTQTLMDIESVAQEEGKQVGLSEDGTAILVPSDTPDESMTKDYLEDDPDRPATMGEIFANENPQKSNASEYLTPDVKIQRATDTETQEVTQLLRRTEQQIKKEDTASTRKLAPRIITQQSSEQQEDRKIDEAEMNIPQVPVNTEDDLDLVKKRKLVISMVEKGVEFFKTHNLDYVFNAFSHGKDFLKGELYLFVYDYLGNCLAHGQESELIWKNLIDMRDSYGTPIVKSLIEKSQKGGGWVTYQWRGSSKVTYVKEVVKEGKYYLIGCGYYPQSKADAVVNLVKGAVGFFNDSLARGAVSEEIFSTLSYPRGRFVQGDLYLYALNFKGVLVAQGDRPGLIGTSAWNVQDTQGKYSTQEIIKKLQETNEGVWVTYMSKNATKIAYAEKVTDKKGNNYAIACGYYPDANRTQVINLVKNGYEYMKKNGKTSASLAFSDRRTNDFRYGDLYLTVYDMKGVCQANGANPDLVGVSQWDVQDEDGRYMVREMIEKGSNGGGWVDFKLKRAFLSSYVERINLGIDTLTIVSGLYPVSKKETMVLMVKGAAGYFRTNSMIESLREFVRKDGSFVRGDLFAYVFDANGICYAYGDDHGLIWRNMMNATDDTGKQFIKLMINTAKSGAGSVSYIINDMRKVVYIEPVEKEGKFFIVGSGFYV